MEHAIRLSTVQAAQILAALLGAKPPANSLYASANSAAVAILKDAFKANRASPKATTAPDYVGPEGFDEDAADRDAYRFAMGQF
jgi:hypothetical protein